MPRGVVRDVREILLQFLAHPLRLFRVAPQQFSHVPFSHFSLGIFRATISQAFAVQFQISRRFRDGVEIVVREIPRERRRGIRAQKFLLLLLRLRLLLFVVVVFSSSRCFMMMMMMMMVFDKANKEYKVTISSQSF